MPCCRRLSTQLQAGQRQAAMKVPCDDDNDICRAWLKPSLVMQHPLTFFFHVPSSLCALPQV